MKRRSSNKRFNIQSKQVQNKVFFLGVGFVSVAIVLSLLYISFKKQYTDYLPTIFSFDECATNKKSIITDTYPMQCKYPDGKTFIQDVTLPIDVSDWEVVDSEMGFSFHCPPSWNCYPASDLNTAGFGEKHYKKTNVRLRRVTSTNFKQSIIRHPDFSSPKQWFSALESKNQLALTAKNSVIRPVEGTDGLDYPIYYGLSYEKMSEMETAIGKVVRFDSIANSADSLMFLSLSANDDVLIISFNPAYSVHDPIVEAVINSFEF